MKKIKKIIKRNKTIYNIILSVSNIINSIPYLIVFNYFKLKKIQNNKIVINNYYNKGYGDNAKYICEYLINNDLINQYVEFLKKNVVTGYEDTETANTTLAESFK